ncbi:MAG: hypothetical protein Q8L78_00470 [Coxiellaceae bacterium]|nr:hypothetical protein [Coxiellaceae bacterium]
MVGICKENHAYWKGLIEEHKRSGQSQRAFCAARGIASGKMSYYRSVLSLQEKAALGSDKKLVPVIVKSASPSPAMQNIKITLPNGFGCEIPMSAETARVKSLVEVLLSC